MFNLYPVFKRSLNQEISFFFFVLYCPLLQQIFEIYDQALQTIVLCQPGRKYRVKALRIWHDTHVTSTKVVLFSRSLTPLVHLCPKLFHPVDLACSISNELPTLWMITNQLKKNINPSMAIYVIRFFLQFGFCFQYQLINLVWLSFDFFHLAEASLSTFSGLYTLMCAIVQKYHKMSYL